MAGMINAADGASSPQKKKIMHGDICPFAIPSLRMGLDKGDPMEAVRTVAEICAILTQFRQLAELWTYQVQARECVQAFLAKERAAAEMAVASSNELSTAISKLQLCGSLYQLCNDLGLFQDVAYRQLLQPLGSSWDAEEFQLKKYSNLSAKISGTMLWKKYMRRRIQQYGRPEDVKITNIINERFAIPLQATCRRFSVKQQRCCLAAAARRALAQEQYKDLPLQYRSAAACMQGYLRRTFLTRRYAILRDACAEHDIQILDDWRKLPSAQQLTIYRALQNMLDPKEAELDQFEIFMQQKASEDKEVPRVRTPEHPKRAPPPLDVFEEEERPPTATFRNKDKGLASDGEQIVGRDVQPEEGMRVIFSKAALEEFPALLEDSGGGIGTITWVDPEDADGDGVTGDVCEVLWDRTGEKGDYRTGFEGQFRLAMVASKRVRADEDDGSEKLVGLDVEPVEGMRVIFCRTALEEFPHLLEDSGGSPEEPGIGIITWVDPEDADGDGITGDICEVRWQKTGIKGDYRTGFEGDFRLALSVGNRKRREGEVQDEDLVGLDVHPREGMRVVLSKDSIRNFPEFLEESGMSSSGMLGAGVITWIDENDLDGDGHTGDVCEVKWERTGMCAKYDTGLNGNFRLAETVSLKDEAAGMKLQKVFRGHQSRRVLRNTLIAKYLQEREFEEVYSRFVSALQLQCSIRCRQARLRLIFERRLAQIRRREQSVGSDPHTAVPLRLQSAFRGHISRSKLRSAILTIFMMQNSIKSLWVEERDTREYIVRARFILGTHPRICWWRNHTVRMQAHRRYYALIQRRNCEGVVWHAFCYWMQHSLDAKDRVDFVSLLIHRIWKHFVYTRLMKDAVYCWGLHTRSNLWISETQLLVDLSHRVYLTRLKFRKMADFELISRKQRECAFRLRARITFVMCVTTLREWHICAWRRIVLHNVGELMLPCWAEFLVWRCFRGLKFNGRKGQIILSRSEISKYTLQQKMASVSKLSQSVMIRYTKKRTGVKGPTRPLQQFVDEETASRTETAMLNNDMLYRPLLVAKSFPYPPCSSAGGKTSDAGSDRSGLSTLETPAYGSAGLARGQPKKKKKVYKSLDKIETSFWDARTRALLAENHNWEVPDGMRLPADLTTYTSTLPDLTRNPHRQTGAEILATRFGIESPGLSSLNAIRPQSHAAPSDKVGRPPAISTTHKQAWGLRTFDQVRGMYPDTRQALTVLAASGRKQNSSLQTRSSTALGRLEGGPCNASFLPQL